MLAVVSDTDAKDHVTNERRRRQHLAAGGKVLAEAEHQFVDSRRQGFALQQRLIAAPVLVCNNAIKPLLGYIVTSAFDAKNGNGNASARTPQRRVQYMRGQAAHEPHIFNFLSMRTMIIRESTISRFEHLL